MVVTGNVLETKNDVELVGLAHDGDREAFGELVRRHGQASRRLALRLVRKGYQAEEIVQEALSRVASISKQRDPSDSGAGSTGLLQNTAVGRLN
jgi:DNA-directed RNA polymerase specialized sigma24 family protein